MTNNEYMTTAGNRSSLADLAVGHLLAERFRVESVLGVGGMSTVYRAVDEALGRTVALKVFRSDLADADDVRRQRDEIQLLASLSAPGLVTLFDAVAEGSEGRHGRAFLVLEFVDGVDLRTRLQDGVLEPTAVARIGADVSGALAYIHSRNVVHRDVKPGNILLPHTSQAQGDEHRGSPQAKLADFGIARLVDDARLTAIGTIIGTASYLSPEQARGAAVGPATDIYSLGLVLLESLTGERAFPGSALESVSARLARDPVIPAYLGVVWAALLGSMTSRSPADRPSATSCAAKLESLATESSPPGPALDPTLVLPETTAVAPGATSVLPQATMILPESTLTSPDRTVVLPAPGPTVKPHRRRRALLVPAIAIAAVLVFAFIVAGLTLSQTGAGPSTSAVTPPASPAVSSPPSPVVSYPSVPGALGQHLAQLQRSVAP